MTNAEFPREARLLQPKDFVRALKTRAQRGRYLWVYRNKAVDNQGMPPARPQLGLMISKKNARTAVMRNAIKRRIREQFRIRQWLLPPARYVVRLSAQVTLKDIANVVNEWVIALERDCVQSPHLDKVQR